MKKRMLFFCALAILLSMNPLGVLAQGKYVAKPNEELYGTWINDKSINSYHVQKKITSICSGSLKAIR
jgi:hypothetical protein